MFRWIWSLVPLLEWLLPFVYSRIVLFTVIYMLINSLLLIQNDMCTCEEQFIFWSFCICKFSYLWSHMLHVSSLNDTKASNTCINTTFFFICPCTCIYAMEKKWRICNLFLTPIFILILFRRIEKKYKGYFSSKLCLSALLLSSPVAGFSLGSC